MKGLALGQTARVERTFTLADIAEYVALSGDPNPVYQTSRPPIPGPLLGSLFSYLLGVQLPGAGTNYLKQRLVFVHPAYVDDPLTASVEIVRLRPDKDLVNLRTVCLNAAGEIVCEGEALVLVRDVAYNDDK